MPTKTAKRINWKRAYQQLKKESDSFRRQAQDGYLANSAAKMRRRGAAEAEHTDKRDAAKSASKTMKTSKKLKKKRRQKSGLSRTAEMLRR